MNGATPEGTRSYFERHSLASPPVNFGRTGWSVSPIGFGGYRVSHDVREHRDALELALTSGFNLIDTSSNYTDGSSEILVGETLNRLMRSGKGDRSQWVVVTKAGYVQGRNMKLVQERMHSGQPFQEVTRYQPGCWHCISPDFLEDQITRSLERLGLSTIDVLLLHNPEYFLKADGDHTEYYRRIQKAFEYLETEVERGRIQYYGISSNSFPDPKESPEYTSLETVWELAPGPNHHFAAIQFPFNLFEPGAALELNNSGKSVTQFAKEKKLGTLVNRPLNAFSGERIVRLADFPVHEDRDTVGRFRLALERAMEVEVEYPREHSNLPVEQLAWGHILNHHLQQISGLESWKQVRETQMLPAVKEAVDALSGNEAVADWLQAYQKASDDLMQAFTEYLESQAGNRSRSLSKALDGVSRELSTSRTLSQKAVRLYRSFEGIDCVLVGMRKPSYVRDLLSPGALERPLAPHQALEAIKAAHEAR